VAARLVALAATQRWSNPSAWKRLAVEFGRKPEDEVLASELIKIAAIVYI
jgi:hypothetical protein